MNRFHMLENDWLSQPTDPVETPVVPRWRIGDEVHTAEAVEALQAGLRVQGPEGSDELWFMANGKIYEVNEREPWDPTDWIQVDDYDSIYRIVI